MEKVKCECGHVNPHGTIFCESCGKSIDDNQENKDLLNMRYEGSARRSQTYNTTWVDKVWNFFSSVKVGVWLIVITLSASAIGTIFPQEMYIPPTASPSDYYESEYGFLGKLYYDLGFQNLYGSWWYMLLIASIGVSLVICSLDRVVPLYRALKKQGVKRHSNFLQRQRVFGKTQVDNPEQYIEVLKAKLEKRRYHVRVEEGNLLAEKGRFSRWGPYVNHIGLIIFLVGALLRFVPGMYIDKVLWIREGEIEVIPGTSQEYYLESHQFIVDIYDKEKENKFSDALERSGGMIPKNFQTNVTLYKRSGDTIAGTMPELEEVQQKGIQVNKPLKFDGFAVYQVDYKLNEFHHMSFILEEIETKKSFGELTIDLSDPETQYELGDGYKVELTNYFPDFYFNSKGEPSTKSKIPNNPAFVFKVYTPDKEEPEVSFAAIGTNFDPENDNEYKLTLAGMDTRNASGLTIRRDYTLGVIAVGGLIFMIGVVQGMYWYHRRIWIRATDNEIWIAGHTNKNWFGLKSDMEKVIEGTSLQVPVDQQELENEKDKSTA